MFDWFASPALNSAISTCHAGVARGFFVAGDINFTAAGFATAGFARGFAATFLAAGFAATATGFGFVGFAVTRASFV